MKVGTQRSVLRSIQTLFSVGSVGGMTDGQLLEEFLSRREEGAEAAFAALVALHGPMVWRVCQGVLPDSHAAEDAFQATFLILVRKAASIRHRDTLASWLYGVARRVAVRAKTNDARRRRNEGERAEMQKSPTPTPDPFMREQLEVLHQEVDRLPEKYRAAVVLCHLEGRTHAEVARLLKCPIGTVSVRVARARELLRDRLTRRGLAFPAGLVGATILSETASAAAIPKGLSASTIKVAMHVAAGKGLAAGMVPAAVAQLTEGVIKTMSMTKLTMAAAGVLAAGITTAAAGLLTANGGPAQVIRGVAPAAGAPAQTEPNEDEARAKSMNNLKQLGLAMHNFASQSGTTSFPPPAITADGKPTLSWRVAILPFLDQQKLYAKFHLDEPWDSPHNKLLLNRMPDVYAPVIKKNEPSGSTYYQVFAGPGSIFDGIDGTKLQDIKDGTSMTILIVEAGKAVPWTKPEDLPFEQDKPLPKLGGFFKDGFNAGFSDGSVRYLRKMTDPKLLRALITRDGGERIAGDEF